MYFSDFPHEVNNDTCRAEILELLENEDLTDADKENLLYRNAEQFYRLDQHARTAATATQ